MTRPAIDAAIVATNTTVMAPTQQKISTRRDGRRLLELATALTINHAGAKARQLCTEPGGRSTPISSQIGGMMISAPRGLQNGVPGGSGAAGGAGGSGAGGATC